MPKPDRPAAVSQIKVQRSFESLTGLCILHTIAISTADPPPRTAPEADGGHSLRSRFGSGEKNPPLSTCKSFHHLRPAPGQLVPPVSSRNAQIISLVSSTYLHISGLNRSRHCSAFRDYFCVLSLHWFQGILRSLPLKRGCIHWQQLLSAATSSQSLAWLWFFTVTERSPHSSRNRTKPWGRFVSEHERLLFKLLGPVWETFTSSQTSSCHSDSDWLFVFNQPIRWQCGASFPVSPSRTVLTTVSSSINLCPEVVTWSD